MTFSIRWMTSGGLPEALPCALIFSTTLIPEETWPKREYVFDKRFALRTGDDEPLTAAGIRLAGVGHGHGSERVLVGSVRCLGGQLVGDGVPRAAAARPRWVPRLVHECRDDPMEDHAVEELVLSQEDEIVDGLGGIFRVERDRRMCPRRSSPWPCRSWWDRWSWPVRCSTSASSGGCGILRAAGSHRRCVGGGLRLLIRRRTAGPRGNGEAGESRALLEAAFASTCWSAALSGTWLPVVVLVVELEGRSAEMPVSSNAAPCRQTMM